MRRPNKHHPRLGPAARRRHARIEQVRRGGARVRHVETLVRQRVRYRGLDRDVVQAAGLCAADRFPPKTALWVTPDRESGAGSASLFKGLPGEVKRCWPLGARWHGSLVYGAATWTTAEHQPSSERIHRGLHT